MMARYPRKWAIMAALTMGTALQLAACREDLAMFGLRTLFSSITVPINQLIQQIIFSTAV